MVDLLRQHAVMYGFYPEEAYKADPEKLNKLLQEIESLPEENKRSLREQVYEYQTRFVGELKKVGFNIPQCHDCSDVVIQGKKEGKKVIFASADDPALKENLSTYELDILKRAQFNNLSVSFERNGKIYAIKGKPSIEIIKGKEKETQEKSEEDSFWSRNKDWLIPLLVAMVFGGGGYALADYLSKDKEDEVNKNKENISSSHPSLLNTLSDNSSPSNDQEVAQENQKGIAVQNTR